jgi:hypothetical protein
LMLRVADLPAELSASQAGTRLYLPFPMFPYKPRLWLQKISVALPPDQAVGS